MPVLGQPSRTDMSLNDSYIKPEYIILALQTSPLHLFSFSVLLNILRPALCMFQPLRTDKKTQFLIRNDQLKSLSQQLSEEVMRHVQVPITHVWSSLHPFSLLDRQEARDSVATKSFPRKTESVLDHRTAVHVGHHVTCACIECFEPCCVAPRLRIWREHGWSVPCASNIAVFRI